MWLLHDVVPHEQVEPEGTHLLQETWIGVLMVRRVCFNQDDINLLVRILQREISLEEKRLDQMPPTKLVTTTLPSLEELMDSFQDIGKEIASSGGRNVCISLEELAKVRQEQARRR